ncbi:MAG: hypothetical protein U1B78_06080 [Dehalococcoidia bacterium]|nr:hypothetical protein [Dehalococcoidia bacterium]
MSQGTVLLPRRKRSMPSLLAPRGRLTALALLLPLLFLLTHVLSHSAQAATQPQLAFPFSPGQSWRITCGYADGDGCQHPNNDWNRYALDLQHVDGGAATEGQPVRASAPGTVDIAGWGGATASAGTSPSTTAAAIRPSTPICSPASRYPKASR